MNKKILVLITVSLALSANVFAFGLGSLGIGGGSEKVGEEQKVPVTDRIQTVDYKYVSDIVSASDQADYLYVNTFKRFATPAACIEALKSNQAVPAGCQKAGREVRESTLGLLKSGDPALYELMSSIVTIAAEEFKIRSVPEEISNKFFSFLTKNGIDNLIVLQVSTGADEETTSARYFPEGKVALLGVRSDQLSDPAYRAQVGFLVAHEMGHALGLHVLEDKTGAADVSGRVSDSVEIATDVAIDKIYSGLDPVSAQLIDSAAKMLSGTFLQTDALTQDSEVMVRRAQSSAVVLAKKFGQGDKVRLLGADLNVPPTTRVVMKKMMSSGMEATQILGVLKNGTDSAAYMLNAASHSKDQEFEADQIGFNLAQKANLDSQSILTFLESRAANEQGGGSLIGGHPAMDDRIKKLKDTYNL